MWFVNIIIASLVFTIFEIAFITITLTSFNLLHAKKKLYLNSKDLQIPTISMTSKYLELKPVEQLNFQSVSPGDLMFPKSIIKHLLKRFGI